MNYVSWVGYLAAALVVLSFMVGSNVRTIRSINLLGCMLFIAYGYWLDINLPIIIPNVFITIIQIYYLALKKK